MAHCLRPERQVIHTGEHHVFYQRTLELLLTEGIPFLVGGAFALDFALGTQRRTKDLDLLIKPEDCGHALEVLRHAGYRTEVTDASWLAKVFCGEDFVDLIFGFGNGLAKVDDSWFTHAYRAELWGFDVPFCGVEESLWCKAFIMERDRFDGADVAHILRLKGDQLDWDHVLRRFGPHWRVLLAHLVLFGYVYPGERDRIPPAVLCQLWRRFEAEEPLDQDVCFGPFLSRWQYQHDLDALGMTDARQLAGED